MYCGDIGDYYAQKKPLSSRPPIIVLLAFILVALQESTLQWTACPDSSTFYCIFFAVPLDYDAPSSGEGTVIAMWMFPTTVSDYGRLGSIFTNPGGPVSSGHSALPQNRTTLGAMYVAMFPKQSERIVLDGVVYAPDQYTSLVDHGLSAGKSTNGVLEGFISNCVAVGPDRYALITSTSTTVEMLSTRIWGLAVRLKTAPLPVAHPTKGVPPILQPGHLLDAILTTILCPVNWATLMDAIAQTEASDGAALVGLIGVWGVD
ncbi:hypothetical protein C8R43DRAFT_1143160 [Mycena crocata]|nr:hypothetical protein C8R43DRAFT_1143160 [Mycena crocata]